MPYFVPNRYRGKLIVVEGIDGSGKTTLLRHLNGLLLPTAGNIRLADAPIEMAPASTRTMSSGV